MAARRILLGVGLIFLFAASLRAAEADKVAVLAADPWCPHTCAAQAPRPGYMIELASQALALKGWKVVYKNAAWARVIRDVKAGKADGAVGALEGEAAGMVLHREPLGRQSNVFVVRADDPWTLRGLDSMKGRKVASVQDYSYSAEIDAWLLAHAGGVQALGGENALERNLQKLLAGRVDVVLEDEAVLLAAQAEGKLKDRLRIAGRMPGGDLFVALTPGRRGKDLAEALDGGIAELRASGRLRQILDGYGLQDWKQ